MLEESSEYDRHFESKKPKDVNEAKKWAEEDMEKLKTNGLKVERFAGLTVHYKLPNTGRQDGKDKVTLYWQALFEKLGATFSELQL